MDKKHILRKAISISAVLAMALGAVPSSLASELNGTKEIVCKVGDNLTISNPVSGAAETQKLIDNKPEMKRPMENLDRGLVAVTTENGNFISWRWLGYESLEVKYNLYKNGTKLNEEPMSLTNYTDTSGKATDKYSVSTVVDGVESPKCDEVSVWDKGYFEIPVDKPADSPVGTNPGIYRPGDVSVGDLDGDGDMEIVLKWDSIDIDAGKGGVTNNCIIDAYELDGTKMWRIDLGMNIRQGPHDTQFIVGDFDGDGAAEVSMRTADGTVAGDGTVIGDAKKDWRDSNGKNLEGPLYNTVFKGSDGSVIDSIPYFQQSKGKYSDGTEWDISSWGDDWGNRSERYLGGYACFDGVHTSFIQSRGYYGRTCIGAYHLENGKIVKDFEFDSTAPEYTMEDGSHPYSGQGYHNLTVADIDYDGKDELVFGNLVLDNDGTPMYSTNLGHGDAQHLGDFVLSNPGLEVYTCQEYRGVDYGFAMRDARTGEFIYGIKTETDNGRACAGDIDPNYEGAEAWSAYGVLTASDGTVISTNYSMPTNATIYWDGDLGKEVYDGNAVYKWNSKEQEIKPIFKAVGAHSINAAKSNPCLQADIIGDWREDLIFAADDMEHLRIYTTTIPTSYRIPTLMHNWEYRDAIGWQNVCYNQPPHVDYNLGFDADKIPVPDISVKGDDGIFSNPDYSKKYWSIKDLYFGDTVELVPGYSTALVNGAKRRVDNDNLDVKPYINSNDRTMVPLRFIAEAFGADVAYDNDTREITIELRKRAIRMVPDNSSYTVDGKSLTMDTAPVISDDRTFVPLRAVGEALDRRVGYMPNAGTGDALIVVSTVDNPVSQEQVYNEIEKIKPVANKVNNDYSQIENYGDESNGLRINITAATALDKADYNLEEGQEAEEPKDASAVIDYDLGTSVTIPAGGCVTIDNGSWAGVPAVVIAFGDDKIHKFRIDYSSNGTSWQIGLADRISDGVKDENEKYYFGCPLYPRYVRYVSMDDTETTISEFAQARVD